MSRPLTNIDDFTIVGSESYLDALRKIDKNRKGFLIVLDATGVVKGTLTDGDIRRAMLAGINMQQAIEQEPVFQTSFSYLYADQSIDDAIDIFKSAKIGFVPIIDRQMHLKSVLTKKALHSLLLQCEDIALDNVELLSVDETLVDFEVFNRPWGIYKTTVLQKNYQSKVLQIKPKEALSMQYHLRREEYWTVAHGNGTVFVGDSKMQVHPGSMIFIPKGCKHRLVNDSTDDDLIVCEVQIGDYFGEDDIVRVDDRYGRNRTDERI